MRIFQKLLPVLALLSPFILISQNIGIHAESIGEWKSKTSFSPEYHYNSVAVYLLNEDKILDLLDPANLTKSERKQTGIRQFDIVESLFFSLQLPNPKQEGDLIHFPLYAFDIHNSKAFQVPRNQGKIIDRITDEELNGKGLEARAKIEAVKKNQLLEVAYQISSSINKILGDRIFHNPGISGVMRKAQEYFEKKYRGKIVAEFTIPILPGNEDYEYRLHSASIYQIKWDFQEKVKTYKNNIWSDLQNQTEVSTDMLKDRPVRLSRYNNHPYLLVLRYKSAYALPERHKLNVEISPAYLNERLDNLQEFQKNSYQYRFEELFLEHLRDALDLERNCALYRRSKEKGTEDRALLIQIAQQYYDILSSYDREVEKLKLLDAPPTYFKENYEIAYYKFFKQLDNLFFLDQQLRTISNVPSLLTELDELAIDQLRPQNIYNYLKTLATYKEMSDGIRRPQGDLYFRVREKITQLEISLYPLVFSISANSDKKEKSKKLRNLKKQYQVCSYCQQEVEKQLEKLQRDINNELLAEIRDLQNRQLKYRICFGDIQQFAREELLKKYPQADSLSRPDQSMYQAYLGKINKMEQIARRFQQIENLQPEDLSYEQLNHSLNAYRDLLDNFASQACQLYYGSLLKEDLLKELPGNCKMAIP